MWLAAGTGGRKQALIAFATLASAADAFAGRAAGAATCESLATLALPDTTITVARAEPAGSFTPPRREPLPGPPLSGLPAFCRVAGEIQPTKDSSIKFEIWMPVSGWNGKLMGIGNGGWSGAIWYPLMGSALRRGYATASTDTGHQGSFADASFALGHHEKVIDFGNRAVHLMTVDARAIVTRFYGAAPPPRRGPRQRTTPGPAISTSPPPRPRETSGCSTSGTTDVIGAAGSRASILRRRASARTTRRQFDADRGAVILPFLEAELSRRSVK